MHMPLHVECIACFVTSHILVPFCKMPYTYLASFFYLLTKTKISIDLTNIYKLSLPNPK